MWNERYANTDYVYGKEPNAFLVEQLVTQKQGKILFVCEGEGRNAVYAAGLGWDVYAFDASIEGYKKAQILAAQKNVKINYQVQDALIIEYDSDYFDAIVIIYAHFPESIRAKIHEKVIGWLKPAGKLFIEGFNKNQLRNSSGGPKDLAMLYSTEMLKNDFQVLSIIELNDHETTLNEGPFHQGFANVCRMIATKK